MSGRTEIFPRAAIGDLAELNPESLGKGTPLDFSFQYLDIQSVTLGSISWKDVSVQQFVSSPSRARRVVRPGDVLLCTVRPYLQANAYAGWSEREDIVCSTGFAVIRSGDNLDSRYLFHHLFFDDVGRQLERLQTGSNYPAVNESDVRVVTLPLPPLSEQRRIAEILDAADETIRKSEALLAKLEQVKAGLLHDLLTRGLDEAGRLRDPKANPEQFQDSVLGRIPREWEMTRVSSLSEAYAGGTPPRGLPGAFGGSIPWVKSAECNLAEITKTEESLSGRGFAVSAAKWIEADTPLIALYGATAGAVSWLTIRATANQAVLAVPSSAGRSVPRWLFWCLRFRAGAMLNTVQGSGQPNLNKDIVTGTLLALPPLPEQRRIAAILDAHDARIRAERAQLDKLRQIKKGLMHDLLTGKVRVQTHQEARHP